jgi:hypothetical protein
MRMSPACQDLSSPRRLRGLVPWPASRRAGVAAGLLLAFAFGAAPSGAMQLSPQAPPPVSLEYAVKATYLYKLAPFVTWPPGEFDTAHAPFTICVVGEDPFGGYLETAVAGRGVGGHPFLVRRLGVLTPAADCQIAFLSRPGAQGIPRALDAVSGKPVLTVVDSVAPDRKGIVQFVIRRGRVGFEINVGAATRNHLEISSKLLSLALAVRDAP